MGRHENPKPESLYCKNSSRKIIIALEELNFIWAEEIALEVAEMWKAGIAIDDMARRVKRDVDEVEILIMHLARKGRIRKREGGGGRNSIPL